jgi:phosphatidate phosphatase APP1
LIQLIVQAVLQQAPRPVQEEGDYFNPPKTVATHISIPISNQQIRVISDIDDTIKISEVLSGVKKIFNNVFVRGLDELIVPGMNTFYQRLHKSGVRFHYVVCIDKYHFQGHAD